MATGLGQETKANSTVNIVVGVAVSESTGDDTTSARSIQRHNASIRLRTDC
jgi:hypothetical protein